MTTTLAPSVPVGKAAVGALGVLALSTGALESVVSPTIPLLERELDMSQSEGALLSIVLLITGALITPLAGKFGDRYGGKKVLIRLMAVVSVGGTVSALAPNLPVLLLGQVLQGAMIGALPLSFIVVRRQPATRRLQGGHRRGHADSSSAGRWSACCRPARWRNSSPATGCSRCRRSRSPGPPCS
ncbi:hypothetical protein STENM36S_09407 [Streptomyces tendae]